MAQTNDVKIDVPIIYDELPKNNDNGKRNTAGSVLFKTHLLHLIRSTVVLIAIFLSWVGLWNLLAASIDSSYYPPTSSSDTSSSSGDTGGGDAGGGDPAATTEDAGLSKETLIGRECAGLLVSFAVLYFIVTFDYFVALFYPTPKSQSKDDIKLTKTTHISQPSNISPTAMSATATSSNNNNNNILPPAISPSSSSSSSSLTSNSPSEQICINTPNYKRTSLFLRSLVGYVGGIMFWKCAWSIIDVYIFDMTINRDIAYSIIGVALLVFTKSLHLNSGLAQQQLQQNISYDYSASSSKAANLLIIFVQQINQVMATIISVRGPNTK